MFNPTPDLSGAGQLWDQGTQWAGNAWNSVSNGASNAYHQYIEPALPYAGGPVMPMGGGGGLSETFGGITQTISDYAQNFDPSWAIM